MVLVFIHMLICIVYIVPRARFKGRLSGLQPRGHHNFMIFKSGYRKNINYTSYTRFDCFYDYLLLNKSLIVTIIKYDKLSLIINVI